MEKVLLTVRMRGTPSDLDEFTCRVNSCQLEQVIQFAYLGYCDIAHTSDAAFQLLKGATYFHMEDVIQFCIDIINNTMDMSTAVHFLLSHNNDCPLMVLEHSITFLLRNLISNRRDINACVELPIELLRTLLLDDQLHAPYEEAVWRTVVCWTEHDREGRAGHIPKILQILRLGMMHYDFLQTQVRQHPLVAENESAIAMYDEIMCEVATARQHPMTPLPMALQPRVPHEIIIAVGGVMSVDTPTDVVEVYDHLADFWVSVPELNLPRQMSYHSLEMIADKLYLIGGIQEIYSQRSSKECWCFDFESFQWHPLTAMQWSRSHVATVTRNGLLYAAGGRAHPHSRQNSVEIYNPEEDIWIRGPKLDNPRSDSALVVLNGEVYLIGGYNGIFVLRDVHCFDTMRQTWVRKASLSVARSGLRCVCYRDYIFAVGGWDGRSRLNCIERYSPEANTWMMLTPMRIARSHFILECLDERLFVFGGYTHNQTISDGEIYSILEDKWYSAGSLSQCKSGFASCVVDNVKITSRILRSIAKRDEAKLLRNPFITRANYVADIEAVRLPSGSRAFLPALERPLPLPWAGLFAVNVEDENVAFQEID